MPYWLRRPWALIASRQTCDEPGKLHGVKIRSILPALPCRAASCLLVLLVGAPRSGTTWLQTMLGAHPDVVTPQETDLFSRYLAPLDDAGAHQSRQAFLERNRPDLARERDLLMQVLQGVAPDVLPRAVAHHQQLGGGHAAAGRCARMPISWTTTRV